MLFRSMMCSERDKWPFNYEADDVPHHSVLHRDCLVHKRVHRDHYFQESLILKELILEHDYCRIDAETLSGTTCSIDLNMSGIRLSTSSSQAFLPLINFYWKGVVRIGNSSSTVPSLIKLSDLLIDHVIACPYPCCSRTRLTTNLLFHPARQECALLYDHQYHIENADEFISHLIADHQRVPWFYSIPKNTTKRRVMRKLTGIE